MSGKISRIGIISGYRCNFSCEHCCFPSDSAVDLTPAEESVIIENIREYNIRSLLFLGGEPSLYISRTNSFLKRLGDLKRYTVRITTNGHFAKSVDSAVGVLSSFLKINHVQLSYDKFHGKFLPYSAVGNMFKACRSLKLGFGVIAAVDSPLDLVLLNKLKSVGNFSVGVQKVLPVGGAGNNGISYKYPFFDRHVLSRRCPNRKVITYLPGKGFSICCSTLALGKKWRIACHPTLKDHFSSWFYNCMAKLSFREIMRVAGLGAMEVAAEQSSPCVLCGAIFARIKPEGMRRLVEYGK